MGHLHTHTHTHTHQYIRVSRLNGSGVSVLFYREGGCRGLGSGAETIKIYILNCDIYQFSCILFVNIFAFLCVRDLPVSVIFVDVNR